MVCERCNKNQATVNLIKYLNGDEKNIWLCDECAKFISELSLLVGSDDKRDINDILDKFIDTILEYKNNGSNKQNISNKEIFCLDCGLKYDEFIKSMRLGCESCYKYFSNEINNILSENNIKTNYFGKFPKFEEYLLENNRKIIKLKCNLEDVIALENYEKAAVIRDEIKVLEKNLKG